MDGSDETVRFLRTIFAAGDVFEIRALNAVTADYQREHAESGYFDFDHIPLAAEAIARLRSYSGAYVTLNPVNPALLGRANNRIAPARRDNSTADGDVLARRWLPIDCDPVRPAGIASTDMEHEAALALAREIRDGLSSLGWPEPVMLDSGNGAQMLYRIELPADDEGLVRRCIEEIAKASTDLVKVDMAVFNAARIWRIAGTMNRKGDPLPDRPHRRARIISVPKTIKAVRGTLLEAVCENTDGPAATETDCGRTNRPYDRDHAFDADRWISEHCPEIGEPKPWNGGRKWVFRVCPFNPAHDNGSAVLIQEASGAMVFKCHHNGCAGNDWRRLREMLEPGCYDHVTPEPLPLDWGALGAKAKPQGNPAPPPKRKEQKDTRHPDPGKLPERLTHIPGFIDDFVEWSMSSAPHPNRVLEFCGALAFLSYIVGRKVTSDRNTLPNIYLIALADSGTGKDHPRKVNMATAIACNAGSGVVEDFTSGAAMEDMLFLNPSVLLQRDEIDTLFNVIKQSKDPNAETMLGKLLTIYGSSNTILPLRTKAIGRGDLLKLRSDISNGTALPSPTVSNPYLVIFGTAIPNFFYESLSPRILGNGMAARCILLDAGRRGPPNRSAIIKPTEGIMRSIEVIRSYGGGANLNAINPSMTVLPVTDEANAMLDEIALRFDAKYHEFDENSEQTPRAFWARANEKVVKLSMLHAISANVANPVVNADAVRWAEEFVLFTTRQSLFLVSSYSYENPFDEKKLKILRYIRDNGGEYAHAELLKRSHESKEVFGKIIDTLEEADEIRTEWRETGGRKQQKVYVLASETSQRDFPGANSSQ